MGNTANPAILPPKIMTQAKINAATHLQSGNCARHCPVGAIQMVPSEPGNDASPKIPAVDEQKCIGCDQCAPHCPQRIPIPQQLRMIDQYVEKLKTSK